MKKHVFVFALVTLLASCGSSKTANTNKQVSFETFCLSWKHPTVCRTPSVAEVETHITRDSSNWATVWPGDSDYTDDEKQVDDLNTFYFVENGSYTAEHTVVNSIGKPFRITEDTLYFYAINKDHFRFYLNPMRVVIETGGPSTFTDSEDSSVYAYLGYSITEYTFDEDMWITKVTSHTRFDCWHQNDYGWRYDDGVSLFNYVMYF